MNARFGPCGIHCEKCFAFSDEQAISLDKPKDKRDWDRKIL